MATIAASDIIETQPLPIDARDICTKVTLVVAGRPSGREPESRETTLIPVEEALPGEAGNLLVVTPYPRPIVYEYEAPEHATYGVHKMFQLPAKAYPFLDPTDSAIPDPTDDFEPVDFEQVRDGKPNTGYQVDWTAGTNPPWVQYTIDSNHHMVGWRAMYWMEFVIPPDKPPVIRASRFSDSLVEGGDFGRARTVWEIPQTHDGERVVITDMWATIHADARQDDSVDGDFQDTLSWQWLSAASGRIQWRVVHFYPLLLDEDYLESIAKSHIRLPASNPERITVAGVVPMAATHTVDGVERVVARQTYEGGVTIIDFEQAGAPVGVPAEAFEAELVRRKREASDRASALYPVTMGPR